jgi:hypothetical protein
MSKSFFFVPQTGQVSDTRPRSNYHAYKIPAEKRKFIEDWIEAAETPHGYEYPGGFIRTLEMLEQSDPVAHQTKKSPRQLDAEIAEALSGSELRVGQLFDRLGHIYEVTKIGRDKLRTIQIARRVRDLFGKETLIDHHSFPLRDRDREYMKPIDLQTAQRRGWPQLVK